MTEAEINQYISFQCVLCQTTNHEELIKLKNELDTMHPKVYPIILSHFSDYNYLLGLRKSNISNISQNTAKCLIMNKIYGTNQITVRHLPTIELYSYYSSSLRKLTEIFATVYLHCNSTDINEISNLFSDNPHIVPTLKLEDESIDISTDPFSSYTPTKPYLTYIVGGRLGDCLHLMYVVSMLHYTTGRKGRIYLTNDIKWGGDVFQAWPRAYDELLPILQHQPYIESIQVAPDNLEDISIDYNLNSFRRSPYVFRCQWFQLLSRTFSTPLIPAPWINLPSTFYDVTYSDIVLIHRNSMPDRYTTSFLPVLENIIKKNKCMFITSSETEYDIFPFRHLLPLHLLPTLADMYTAINSCKFFIGNQSSPLVFAFSLYKPLLAELCNDGVIFYWGAQIYHPGFHWVSQHEQHLSTLSTYINV